MGLRADALATHFSVLFLEFRVVHCSIDNAKVSSPEISPIISLVILRWHVSHLVLFVNSLIFKEYRVKKPRQKSSD